VHGGADRLVPAEGEAQVRYAARDAREGELGLDPGAGLDEVEAVPTVLLHARREGEDVGIEHDVARREARADQEIVGALRDLDLPRKAVRLPPLVEEHDDGRGAEVADGACALEEGGLPLLERYRVHEALALDALQALDDNGEVRRVDDDGEDRGLGIGGHEAQEFAHRGFGVEHRVVHADVDHPASRGSHLEGDLEALVELPFLDQPEEFPRARHVGPLADVDEGELALEGEGFEARQPQGLRPLRGPAWRLALGRARERGDVLGEGAAAAAHDVDETILAEAPRKAGEFLRALVVASEAVRKAGVGMSARPHGTGPREFLEEGPELRRAERAVEAHAEGLRVLEAHAEGLEGLAREVASGGVRDRHRYHDGIIRVAGAHEPLEGVDGGLGVEGVEDGLDEEEVDAAVHEGFGFLRVGLGELVEAQGAVGRALHVGRDAQGLGRGAEIARNEAGFIGRRRGRRRFLGDPRRCEVQLPHEAARAEIRLGEPCAVEGVRLEYVRARAEVGVVDAADDIRASYIEDIAIPAEGDFDAPRPLDEDAVRLWSGAGSAILVLREPVTLDQGTLWTVEDEDLFLA